MKKNKGFTLIELLVVIAIIGLLSTLAVVALNSARQKSRDAKRIADIKQIQSALEMYFNDCNAYPTTLSTSASNGCPSGVTFGNFMSTLPTNPSPNGSTYIYTGYGSTPSSYALTFSLEGQTGGLATGAHTATQSGIQ